MAADGQGNLLICDPENHRVVVSERDGKRVGTIPASAPELVAVDKRSGAVYVLNLGQGALADLIKFSGWKDVKVCMVYMTHTHGIRHDGHHFIFEADKTRGPKALLEFLPSGERVGGPIIWRASDAVVGPKFDAQGNIYIADQVRPKDQLLPPEFADYVGPIDEKTRFQKNDPHGNPPQMYGSIMKFTPKGGMIDWKGVGGPRSTTAALVPNPFKGEAKLDPSLKTIEAACFVGNSESRGPDSPVIDPSTGKLRQRKPSDPASLESPFAEPAIAFSWLAGVGVTDDYAYMGDSLNRRLLRARLVYTTEATCAIE